MSKPKVVVTRMTPGLKESSLWQECDVWAWEEDTIMPREILLKQVPTAEGLYTSFLDNVDQELLDIAPNLRAVSNYAVGVNNFNLPALTARNIPAGYTPDAVTEATADMTFALLLSLSRRIVEANQYVKTKQWSDWSPYLMIANDVHSKVLGILGLGRIGEAIARRAAGFNMPIIYHSRSPKPDAEQRTGAQYRDFDALLAEADILVTILPLTDHSYHIIDAAALAKMKPSALLINTARGGIVDHKALYQALKEKRLNGAALDVTEPEPVDPSDPLLNLDNVLVVPHVGTSTWETRHEMTTIAVNNLLCGLNGTPMQHCINPEAQTK